MSVAGLMAAWIVTALARAAAIYRWLAYVLLAVLPAADVIVSLILIGSDESTWRVFFEKPTLNIFISASLVGFLTTMLLLPWRAWRGSGRAGSTDEQGDASIRLWSLMRLSRWLGLASLALLASVAFSEWLVRRELLAQARDAQLPVFGSRDPAENAADVYGAVSEEAERSGFGQQPDESADVRLVAEHPDWATRLQAGSRLDYCDLPHQDWWAGPRTEPSQLPAADVAHHVIPILSIAATLQLEQGNLEGFVEHMAAIGRYCRQLRDPRTPLPAYLQRSAITAQLSRLEWLLANYESSPGRPPLDAAFVRRWFKQVAASPDNDPSHAAWVFLEARHRSAQRYAEQLRCEPELRWEPFAKRPFRDYFVRAFYDIDTVFELREASAECHPALAGGASLGQAKAKLLSLYSRRTCDAVFDGEMLEPLLRSLDLATELQRAVHEAMLHFATHDRAPATLQATDRDLNRAISYLPTPRGFLIAYGASGGSFAFGDAFAIWLSRECQEIFAEWTSNPDEHQAALLEAIAAYRAESNPMPLQHGAVSR
ncbi:MAG: hypothetical protein KDB14_20410 [Planctomycetales bacterium]|nr:hypothetical protein [Planctomycetales bacterium]